MRQLSCRPNRIGGTNTPTCHQNDQSDAGDQPQRRWRRNWGDGIYVAVPPDREERPGRCVTTFTQGLHALPDGLHTCGMQPIAMESIGVYWIPLFHILVPL